jgi:hypothetical protein
MSIVLSDSEYDSEYDSAATDDSAGSLKDFLVDDSDEEEVEVKKVNENEALRRDEDEIRNQKLEGGTVFEGGVRRSTRSSKGVVRYKDENYDALMLSDVDSDISDTDDDNEDDNDSDYEYVSDE